MICLIDMGNSNLTIAAWQGDDALHKDTLFTNRNWGSAQYAIALAQLFENWGRPVFSGCALSSVVPALTDAVADAMQKVTGHAPVLLNYEGKRPFKVLTQDKVGADILAGAEAVIAHYRLPAIVADFGSCTTFGAQNAAGDVLGVAIAPGVELGLEAMVGRANHLRTVAFEAPAHAIGITTEESIQSGVLLGAASMLEGMFRRIASEMPKEEGEPLCIVTGGLAGLIAPFCSLPVTLAPNLLHQGLYEYYKNNQ